MARMEVILSIERRRRWPVEVKLIILAELAQPGARFCDVQSNSVTSAVLLQKLQHRHCAGNLIHEMGIECDFPLRPRGRCVRTTRRQSHSSGFTLRALFRTKSVAFTSAVSCFVFQASYWSNVASGLR